MFLNYVVWGSWYVTLGTYLTATLHFSGTQTGAVFDVQGPLVEFGKALGLEIVEEA